MTFGMRDSNPTLLLPVPQPGAARTQAATENQHNTMQNYCKTIGALAAASALVAGNANAEVEYELHTGFTSEYLYRGVILGQSLVEAGADVKTEAYGLGLSAGAWYGSFEQTGSNVTELDLYSDVSKDFGILTGSVGYIYRSFDAGSNEESTGEVYFAAAHDFGFAKASLTYYWGVDDIAKETTEGYTELAFSRSFELNSCLNLNVGTNVGYLADDGEFTAWTTKVALDWGFAEHAKLSPFVAVSVALGEQSDTLWYNTANEIVGGAMLSVGF